MFDGWYFPIERFDKTRDAAHMFAWKDSKCKRESEWDDLGKVSPEFRYCGLSKLEMDVFDAVANFNYGSKACVDIFKFLNIVPGAYMERMCKALNTKRKSLSS